MSNFKVDFSRVDVTPPLGIAIFGYFTDRFAEGILDARETNTQAVSCGESCTIIVVLDNLIIDQTQMDA